jgi:membrane-bound lytic murein transglycosylase B
VSTGDQAVAKEHRTRSGRPEAPAARPDLVPSARPSIAPNTTGPIPDTEAPVPPDKALDPAEIHAFVREMSLKHPINAAEWERLLARVIRRDDILEAIARPAEGKPWGAYRKIFLTPERTAAGIRFLAAHRKDFARAERTYGVPAETIAAIIGVETFYGRNQGKHRVIDALATLAFHHPKRAAFFRTELAQYLLLSRAEGWDPFAQRGSYAGAMGYGQFMPSSYQNFAVDFDGDGRRDLLRSIPDAIGSVANYFRHHGWQRGLPVVVRAEAAGAPPGPLTTALEPTLTVAELRQAGLTVRSSAPANTPVSFIDLTAEDGHEYWVGFQNFYTITRYNHSALYAMAVWQLAGTLRGHGDR